MKNNKTSVDSAFDCLLAVVFPAIAMVLLSYAGLFLFEQKEATPLVLVSRSTLAIMAGIFLPIKLEWNWRAVGIMAIGVLVGVTLADKFIISRITWEIVEFQTAAIRALAFLTVGLSLGILCWKFVSPRIGNLFIRRIPAAFTGLKLFR